MSKLASEAFFVSPLKVHIFSKYFYFFHFDSSFFELFFLFIVWIVVYDCGVTEYK